MRLLWYGCFPGIVILYHVSLIPWYAKTSTQRITTMLWSTSHRYQMVVRKLSTITCLDLTLLWLVWDKFLFNMNPCSTHQQKVYLFLYFGFLDQYHPQNFKIHAWVIWVSFYLPLVTLISYISLDILFFILASMIDFLLEVGSNFFSLSDFPIQSTPVDSSFFFFPYF